MSYRCKPLSAGRPAVCIGSGPSLTLGQVNYVKGKAFVIVINNNYKRAPWADVLYGCDKQWWDWHYEKTAGFKGIRITQSDAAGKAYSDLKWIRGEKVDTGLSDSPDYIKTGKLGGYQAINLAVNFGAKEIILIGYDCKMNGSRRHWHANHPSKANHNYTQWADHFRNLNPDLEARGVTVWNCTPGSAIDAFQMRKLKDVI